MIEKLKLIDCGDYSRFPNEKELMNKINEIIDKVNQIEKAYNEDHIIQLDEQEKEESETPLVDAFIKIFDDFKGKESDK